MTSQSPRIYLYKITFEEVPYYYYGVHREKKYNEKYWGSPKTNKWCWKLYTPKKQILQLFDYTDEGWLEANSIERRVIKLFYNIDKWCLNENCGGVFSTKICRKNGLKHKKNKTGFFSLSKEKRVEISVKNGFYSYENKSGCFSLNEEERSKLSKRTGLKVKEQGIGIFGLTEEQISENCRKGGKKQGTISKENKMGIFSLTPKEMEEIRSRKYECCETGYISNAAGIVRYQKARGIDTSKNNRKQVE